MMIQRSFFNMINKCKAFKYLCSFFNMRFHNSVLLIRKPFRFVKYSVRNTYLSYIVK